jgi:hypothetical protein
MKTQQYCLEKMLLKFCLLWLYGEEDLEYTRLAKIEVPDRKFPVATSRRRVWHLCWSRRLFLRNLTHWRPQTLSLFDMVPAKFGSKNTTFLSKDDQKNCRNVKISSQISVKNNCWSTCRWPGIASTRSTLFPMSIVTLFIIFDAIHITWKLKQAKRPRNMLEIRTKIFSTPILNTLNEFESSR